jgi:hypothetical protein
MAQTGTADRVIDRNGAHGGGHVLAEPGDVEDAGNCGTLQLACRAVERHEDVRATSSMSAQIVYLTSVSILNIGMYIAMMITPTIRPTPIIMIGSMIEVSEPTAASTSSS